MTSNRPGAASVQGNGVRYRGTYDEKPHGTMTKPARRILLLAVAGLLTAAYLLWFGIDPAFARAGGGGSFGGGGGGGSGGGGGGGDGDGLFFLIYLCFRYPLIGIPLLLLFLGFSVYGGDRARKGYISTKIRRARVHQDQIEQNQVLATLRERDPAFDTDKFLERTGRAFLMIQDAWSRQDMSPARGFISDGIFQRFSIQFEMQKAEGYRNVMQNVRLQRATIAAVVSDRHFDTIHVEFRASAADFDVGLAEEKRLRGAGRPEQFVEYWSFFRRPGAKTLTRPGAIEGNCPGCGAPLEVVDRAQCPSCGSTVNSAEHDWVLAEITQATEWTAREEVHEAPGVAELRKSDPDFNDEHIEDRTSVMFWRVRAAEFFHDVGYSRPVLSESMAKRETARLAAVGDRPRFFQEAAVGKVELVDVIPTGSNGSDDGMDRVRVVVRWSGVLAERTPAGAVRVLRPKAIRTQLFVLARRSGVKTRADQTFSTSRCQSCGGPISVSQQADCPFCGAALTDGNYGWVLDGIERYTPDLAFRDMTINSRTAKNAGPRLSNNDLVSWELSLAVLAKMMFADGRLHEKELQVLERIGRARGLTGRQIQAVINTARNGDVDFPVPQDVQQGRRYLEQLVRAALADGRISSAEQQLITSSAGHFGLSAADVNLVIKSEQRREYQVAKEVLRSRKTSHAPL